MCSLYKFVLTTKEIMDAYVWNKENDKHKDKGREDFEL